MERLAPAYGDDWWYQSALAFTYHEVDRFDESRRLSEASLQKYPRNAHAAHNLAHIAFETLDCEAGAAFLDEWMAGYDRRASFHCHMAWHQAMFALHAGRYAQRDRDLRARDPALGQPALGHDRRHRAALAVEARRRRRARCRGAPSPTWPRRSRVPASSSARCTPPSPTPACGDQAALDRQADGLRALGAKGHPIAARVVLPLVLGTAAFAAGDHAGALRHFEPVEAEMHRIGGSHAQWEIYEETMVQCYLALQRWDDATRLISRRLARRASPRDQQWLARAGRRGN